jgi:arylsulfatase A-like enzyme
MKALFLLLCFALTLTTTRSAPTKPDHVILVMADDQGWGQMGYMGHPHLKTPHLDEMAAASLRFDRFYSGGCTCSPTRASVMTGRSNERTGVMEHGYPLRLQEKTLASAMRGAGYLTAHFGKWHLNGLRGAGVPILKTDLHGPGAFGFDHWLSVTNFFDRNPLLSRDGEFTPFEGDSSEIVVAEALAHLKKYAATQPTFSVIWYGTPHDPFVATPEDRAPFAALSESHQNQYGELVAMDRSIGALRAGLRDLGIAGNTILWFCSDNGGLAKMGPETVGGLRAGKGTLWEGGIRVPGLLEWPEQITSGRRTDLPAGTVDMFPTLAELVGLPASSWIEPQDGISLVPLIADTMTGRSRPLYFRQKGEGALVEARYKYHRDRNGVASVYDLVADPAETNDLSAAQPELSKRLADAYQSWSESADASLAGTDYPEGQVDPNHPGDRSWIEAPEYAPYLEDFAKRPEYRKTLAGDGKPGKGGE